MKKVCTFLLMTAIAVSFAACGGAAENKPANVANTNTKPAAPAAPTADALLALDKAAQEAWSKNDPKWFEDNLSDKFSMMENGKRMDKAGTVEMIKSGKCDVKSMNFTEPMMSKIDNDTYVVSYKGTYDGSCTMGGKTEKLPSPMRAASVYVRSGADKWLAAWHGETMIVEPKTDAKKDDAAKMDDGRAKDVVKKEEPKKDDAAAKKEEAAEAAKEESAKKEAAAKKEDAAKKDEVAKKDDVKKDDAKKDEKAAPAEAPKPDANTDALVKIHTSGWEAWKAKDAKKLEEISTNDLSIVDPVGMWMSGRAAVVKHWTEGMKCEGVNNVKVSDGFASAISPTVELLTLKGTADGTCDGHKNSPLWQAAVYVKEGNDWKLAFMFETPAK